MSYFAFSGLVNGLISTVCGTIVFFQNPSSRKNQVYGLYCLSLSTWAYFYFLWFLATDHDTALFYARALMVGAIFIPTLHYHQIMALFNLQTSARLKWLKFSYLLCICFLVFNFSKYFVADVGPKMMIRFWQIPGPLFHPFLVFFVWQVVLSNWMLWTQRKTASPVLRNELKWTAIATTIGYAGGCTNFFLQYDIPIPPYGNILGGVYVGTVALLFFRLGLLDVRSVIKRASLVLLIYGSLMALILPAAIPYANHVLSDPKLISVKNLLLFGVVIGAALSIGPFLYAYFVKRSFWLRGNISTGLTHELKSPLSSIQGALDIALAQLQSPNTDKEKALFYLRMIEQNTNRLDHFVKNLLHVAKSEEGAVSLNKSTTDLSELIRKTVQDVRPQLDQKQLTLSVDIPEKLDVLVDEQKIDQVFSNLLSNAIKFSDHGTISIAMKASNSVCEFSIRDEGRGIATKDLDKVFDRFYQVKESSKGSGIGLTIAKAWVEAHGGKIWAESEGEGKGTMVRFTLPINL